MAVLGSIAIEFDLTHRTFKEVPLDELEIDLRNKKKIYWVHSNLNQQDIFKKLVNKLQLPDDVVELCNQEDTMPKLIDNDEAITTQIQGLLSTELSEEHHNETHFANLIIHLTSNFCFTAASEEIPALLEFIKSFSKAIRYAQTPCFILFLIFDNVVNEYARILFNFEVVADQMDLRVRAIHNNIYNEVMEIKQEVMKVKRYTIAAREILMRLSGRKISVISEQCRVSLYNLSNHSHMVVHEADSIRDILNGLLDQIDNTLMQKMSETMKVLTAVAAIFLPLTLITGIYGMNFRWIPELSWKYGYFWALGLIVVCGATMLYIFKKMKWF